MIGNSIIRSLGRRFSAGVIWAMIPLAAWGGMPTLSCACLDCHCGATCEFASHGTANPAAANPSDTVDSHNQTGCCSCCGCANCQCAAGCCCCQMKKFASKAPTCKHEGAPGFSQSQDGCKTSVSTVTAIRPTLVALNSHQPWVVAIFPPISASQSNRTLDRADPLNTGPPVDLVLTLGRLLI
jgi:hypothetical protein